MILSFGYLVLHQVLQLIALGMGGEQAKDRPRSEPCTEHGQSARRLPASADPTTAELHRCQVPKKMKPAVPRAIAMAATAAPTTSRLGAGRGQRVSARCLTGSQTRRSRPAPGIPARYTVREVGWSQAGWTVAGSVGDDLGEAVADVVGGGR
jgi:hypothetical protein